MVILTHFIFREWNEQLVSDVCSSLANELILKPGAPGGMETYRQSLTLSFFFKFYLQVLEFLDGEVSPSERSAFSASDHKTIHSAQFYQVSIKKLEKVYLKSQILVHEYWTILDHFCVPVL